MESEKRIEKLWRDSTWMAAETKEVKDEWWFLKHKLVIAKERSDCGNLYGYRINSKKDCLVALLHIRNDIWSKDQMRRHR